MIHVDLKGIDYSWLVGWLQFNCTFNTIWFISCVFGYNLLYKFTLLMKSIIEFVNVSVSIIWKMTGRNRSSITLPME